MTRGVAASLVLLLGGEAHAEGHAQIGFKQRLKETNEYYVDVQSATEWINVAACGENRIRSSNGNIEPHPTTRPTGYGDVDDLRFEIRRVPAGHDIFSGQPTTVQTFTPAASNGGSGTPFRFDQNADAPGPTAIGKLDCKDPLTGPIANPWRVRPGAAGLYEVRVENMGSGYEYLSRLDITVTPDGTTLPNPKGNQPGDITGRVFSYQWRYNAGSFKAPAAATSAYYMLVPGGYANSNYVWRMDFDEMAGYGYSIIANALGVDKLVNGEAPNAGFSTPAGGGGNRFGSQGTLNAKFGASPLYPVYLNDPARALPPPGRAPLITGFTFIDDEGKDVSISPGGSGSVQDKGFFKFRADTATNQATYEIAIDVDQNGEFGNAGDVRLLGTVTGNNVQDSREWDGRDSNGQVLPDASYPVRLRVRLGEFHFVGKDIETVGGPNGAGLTIREVRNGGLHDTHVYWDDTTVIQGEKRAPASPVGAPVYDDRLNKGRKFGSTNLHFPPFAGACITGPPSGPSTLPQSTLPNGLLGGRHRWGNFDPNCFGDEMWVDTYVYGDKADAFFAAVVVSSGAAPDAPVFTDAIVSIVPDAFDPGASPTIVVVDPDTAANADPNAPDTVTVTVTGVNGDAVTLVLTETGNASGIFTATLPTERPGAGTAGNPTLDVGPRGTITAVYNDPKKNDLTSGPISDTATVNNVAPAATDDTDRTRPGETIRIEVLANDSDADGDTLTVTGVGTPANGTATIKPDGTIDYTPNAGFTGPTDTFTYTVSDGHGGTATATVTVTIDPAAVVARDDVADTPAETPVTTAVMANDLGLTPGATVTLVGAANGGAANGTATVNLDGSIEYTPNADFHGTDTVTYRVCAGGLCDEADLVVTVRPTDPIAEADAVSTLINTTVVIPVLANDVNSIASALTPTIVTGPANGMASVNPDGTFTYTPNPGFTGVDTITYDACNTLGRCARTTATVTVEPPVGDITGVVWRDIDSDRTRDAAEPLESGWVVELYDAAGTKVGQTVTDASGAYSIGDVPPAAGYTVRFRHPETGVEWGMIDDITVTGGTTVLDRSLPIDPSGVVYDSISRAPIPGARLVLTDAAGRALPAVCLVSPSQQPQTTGTDGRYRFDVVPGAAPECPARETEYRIALTPPASHPGGLSGLIPPQPGALDPTGRPAPVRVAPTHDQPQAGEDTTYYLAFRLAPGDPDVVNNHIPLDAVRALPLIVSKVAQARTVTVGDLVPYTITIANPNEAPRLGFEGVDRVPAGFKYVDGSARLTGTVGGQSLAGEPREPVRSGRELRWPGLDVGARAELRIDLVLIVGSGVGDGEHVNAAWTVGTATQATISNIGEATVRMGVDPIFDCALLIGKVFEDLDRDGVQDAGERGVPHARLATARGLLVTTDEHGRYSLPCAGVPDRDIGSNFILKLDPRSLGQSYAMTTENPRVVRLTRGMLTKANFGVIPLRDVTVDLTGAAFVARGAVLLPQWLGGIEQLVTVLEAEPATLTLVYHGRREADAAERALEIRRLREVTELVETRWRARRRTDDLSVSRRIVREDRP